MPSVIGLNAIMLNDFLLSVIVMSVIMLNVVAAFVTLVMSTHFSIEKPIHSLSPQQYFLLFGLRRNVTKFFLNFE
jgi:hypothetical protein